MKIAVEVPQAKYLSLKKCLENGIALGMTDIAILKGTPLPQGMIATDKAIEIIRKYLGYSDGQPYNTVDAIIEDILYESDT